MKIHLYIALVFSVIMFPYYALANEAPRFFSLIPDLPLMEGMIELEDQSLVFDKAHGRIIESQAIIKNGKQATVNKFYTQSLPQFGWQKNTENSYKRGTETLSFHYEQDQENLLVNLIVRSPQ